VAGVQTGAFPVLKAFLALKIFRVFC